MMEHLDLCSRTSNLFPHYSVMKNITDAPLRVQKRKKEEVYKEGERAAYEDGSFL